MYFCTTLTSRFLALLFCVLVPAAAVHGQEKKYLTFGIVPQQSATRLAREWTPLTRYLSEQTGEKIIFKTAPNIPIFEERLAAGDYDIAYMNPYHYTVFHEQPGYIAIAKEKAKRIQGLIVVKKDSPIQDISELNGVKMAFPAPAAFAASVLPRAALAAQGIVIEPVYVSSHDSVYLAVDKGFYTAGGGIVRTLTAMPANIQNNLRVLWRTEKYTPHAIAVHPDLPLEIREKLTLALTSLAQTPDGEKLLQGINLKEIERANNDDWDDIRSLGIDLLTRLKDG